MNKVDVLEVASMKIVDCYGVNDGSTFVSVELAEDRFVDVKVCDGDLNGLVYVMENEDGSTVYSDKAYSREGDGNLTFPGFEYDEKAVLKLVKETLKEFGRDCMGEDGSFPLPSFLKDLEDNMKNVRVFRWNEEDFGVYPDGLKYWSNFMGELYDPQESWPKQQISAADLPEELKPAYFDVAPFGRFGSHCNLVETENGYGIALHREYDENLAQGCGISVKELFELAVKDAERIAADPVFQNADIFVEEHLGVTGHQVIVVVPADIGRGEFDRLAKRLDEQAYQAAYELATPSLESKIGEAEKSRVVPNRDQGPGAGDLGRCF